VGRHRIPRRLKGDQIPLLARILQVVDIYDALTTARPYKLAKTHEESLQIMQSEADCGWRDTELVSLFREVSGSLGVFTPQAALDLSEDSDIRASLENMRRELLK